MLELKITVQVPDDLLRLRSREWFRSEFEEACKEHVDVVRAVLTVRRRRKKAASKPVRYEPGPLMHEPDTTTKA